MSFVKMRQGESQKMNYWMRARVVFQASTVAALAIGAYALGQTKQQKEARARDENEAVLAKAAQDRAEFWDRLAAAEEAERQEDEMKATSSRWWGVLGSISGGSEVSRAADAPSSEANAHNPSMQDPASAPISGSDSSQGPVSSPSAAKKSSWWPWSAGVGRRG